MIHLETEIFHLKKGGGEDRNDSQGLRFSFNIGKNVNNVTVSELLQTVALHQYILFESNSFMFLWQIK